MQIEFIININPLSGRPGGRRRARPPRDCGPCGAHPAVEPGDNGADYDYWFVSEWVGP